VRSLLGNNEDILTLGELYENKILDINIKFGKAEFCNELCSGILSLSTISAFASSVGEITRNAGGLFMYQATSK
jgi:hypothetical protein